MRSVFIVSTLIAFGPAQALAEEAPEAGAETEASVGLAAEAGEADATVISVFSQKGGMLLPGEHSIYLRTNDEWTGFSTFYLGYRYGVTGWFDIAVEAAASAVPHVYLGAVLTHWRLYESPGRRVFIGLRTHTGYRYQDSDFSSEGWQRVVGPDYLTVRRNGLYLAFDLTAAVRFGRDRRHALYYTIYPRIDIDFVDAANRVYVMVSPATVGYEFRWRRYPGWSFAIEAGYAFPVPWDSIEPGRWPNFPSLANIGFYYRF